MPFCAITGDRGRPLGQQFVDPVGGLGDAGPQRHRIGAGRHIADALGDDRLGENGRGGGSVTRDVIGLGRGRLGQLGAHVFFRIIEFDVPGDGDAVVGDRRAAELFVQHHIPATRAEGDLDRVGQLVHATLQRGPGLCIEADLLRHVLSSPLNNQRDIRAQNADLEDSGWAGPEAGSLSAMIGSAAMVHPGTTVPRPPAGAGRRGTGTTGRCERAGN